MTPMAAPQSTLCKMRFVVTSEYGLHMRAASMLVKIAESYEAQLTIECGPNQVNGKSIMSLLGLGLSKGTPLLATAEGPEAEPMMWALTDLFANRFYEATGAAKSPRA